MINHLRRLSRIGVTDSLPASEAKHIIFLNGVVFLVLFIGIQNIAMALTYLPATHPVPVFMVMQVIGIALVLLWNHKSPISRCAHLLQHRCRAVFDDSDGFFRHRVTLRPVSHHPRIFDILFVSAPREILDVFVRSDIRRMFRPHRGRVPARSF
jgi:hypothetical protein